MYFRSKGCKIIFDFESQQRKSLCVFLPLEHLRELTIDVPGYSLIACI